ncbi:hypothetical protein QJS04_geneDACA012596 [Acorus gramineus]|uniref:Uncharacterized protein n=1 Tax=Acorus gramineus TaxID=55184 RepID=A0AAV9B6C0_ACOGR|nr:hypothetical protein QJS04_geneDACA012596 [Acorus gramineus]
MESVHNKLAMALKRAPPKVSTFIHNIRRSEASSTAPSIGFTAVSTVAIGGEHRGRFVDQGGDDGIDERAATFIFTVRERFKLEQEYNY